MGKRNSKRIRFLDLLASPHFTEVVFGQNFKWYTLCISIQDIIYFLGTKKGNTVDVVLSLQVPSVAIHLLIKGN